MPAVMFVRNPETKDLEHYKGPVPGSNQPLPDINVLVRKPWPGASVEKIPSTTWCHESLSYIVRNQDVRGKFDAKKAIELKVRKGPDYAKLARGETVTSEDGKMITPDMVLGPARLGKGTAIIDLPTPAYVDDLVNRSEWSSPAVTMNLEVIIWILGPGVGEHPKLHEFVAKMPQCKHTVSSPDYCPNYLSMKSIGESTTRMGFLIPENYPTPVHDNMTIPQPSSTTPETVRDMSKAVSLQPLEPGVLIEMEPKFEINRSEVEPPFDANNVTKMMPLAVVQRMDVISKRMRKQEFEQKLQDFRKDLPGADAEIITLGTGSSAPSKYRNVSSTLLHVPGEGYYLFDCGENTLGQLKRVFPPEKLREVLRNLRVVWISHLHADHHLGTASVLRAWFEENYPDGISHSDEVEMGMSKILQDKRLFVVSDAMMTCWLEEYASVENFGFGKIVPLSAAPYIEDDTIKTRFVYRHCRSDGTYPGHETADGTPSTTALSFLDETSPLTPLLHQATGLANILTCRVSHCRGALAVSLVFPSGFKVSFSGDCRPSASFVAIGQNSTVLIHEATFQDDMAISAKAKKHSTVSEALEVGRRMNARAILLTHFSQRYQKVARVDENDANPIEEASNHVGQVGLDVPDDEPSESSAPLRLTGEIQVSRRPHVTVPVVGAHDYMRIRVSNMLHAQLHAPAVDKLFETLERMQLVEAQKRRDAVREVEKARSKAKQAKKAKHGMLDAPPAEMDVDKPESTTKNEKSVWSASESESGWSTSGSETEEWMDKKRLLYGRSQSPRRSPRHRKR
ncbi:hypothetical protein BO71DRAFT_400464 [Aspergillus ellipticus CBS 707.79]|uniref:ribonuclease Z n=1 Tax=Aspergillus ellipticus CBS 707.79 TaxID=1448320 RepID=A0A319DE66_9EURO|nr:hypothetical protein BO71DRAFT_400464 [Aspergillus ellipticus CBS 707.79]